MNINITRYPLDLTGVSKNNLVTGEVHKLSTGRAVRVFAMDAGAFYADGLNVYDAETGVPLKPGQFVAEQMLELPSVQAGMEVCTIVLVTDPKVSDTVACDYQALGGDYIFSTAAIIQMIQQLNLDNRPTYWPNILGKPEKWTPAHHLHDIGDVYGFEYIVVALERIRQAIELGDASSHDAFYKYVDSLISVMKDAMGTINSALQTHVQDLLNPHKTTNDQVDAYNKAYIDAMETRLTKLITDHINKTGNAHSMTTDEFDVYTKEAIDSQMKDVRNNIGDVLNKHINATGNVHSATPADIGTLSAKDITDLLLAKADKATALTQDSFNTLWDLRLDQRFVFQYA